MVYKPFEAYIGKKGFVVLLLLGAFMVQTIVIMFQNDFHEITTISDEKGTYPYVLILYWQLALLVLQTAYRSFFWRRLDPLRHIFATPVLYLVAIMAITLSVFIALNGIWKFVFPATYGMALLIYAIRRPKHRKAGPLLRFLVVSAPLSWQKLWAGRLLHVGFLVSWSIFYWVPWEVIGRSAWINDLVSRYVSLFPAARILRAEAASPDYAVGLYVVCVTATFLLVVFNVIYAQAADRVIDGTIELRYARRNIVLGGIVLWIVMFLSVNYLTIHTPLSQFTKSNNIALSLSAAIDLAAENILSLWVASNLKGLIGYYSQRRVV